MVYTTVMEPVVFGIGYKKNMASLPSSPCEDAPNNGNECPTLYSIRVRPLFMLHVPDQNSYGAYVGISMASCVSSCALPTRTLEGVEDRREGPSHRKKERKKERTERKQWTRGCDGRIQTNGRRGDFPHQSPWLRYPPTLSIRCFETNRKNEPFPCLWFSRGHVVVRMVSLTGFG